MNPPASSPARPLSPRPSRPRLPLPRRLAVIGAASLLVLLGGCALVGGGKNGRITVYTLDPAPHVQPEWPRVSWQLLLPRASASRVADGLRIAVRPSANELQVYKGASWARTPTDMIEDALMRTLEDSGHIPAVARQGSGVGADYKLVLDLRRFDSDYVRGTPPAATIELNAKLLHSQDQQVIAARTFVQAVPARSTAVADVVVAFEQALAAMTGDVAGWVLDSGDRHERGHAAGD